MNIRTALAISLTCHCCILAPLGNIWFPEPDKKTNEPEVVYYKIPEPNQNATVKTETPPPPDVKIKEPAAAPKKEKSQIVKRVRLPRSQEAQVKPPPPKPAKDNIILESIPGTTMPHTPECVNYYKYIREEIRRFLKRYYTNEYREGDVMVSFVLAQNGQLTSLNIVNNRSSDDPGLRSLSYKSIQSAAPFKPFPKNLDQKEISFNLSILFKKS